MKEQLKKILAGKCHNEEATNRAAEEVYNLIESNQKDKPKKRYFEISYYYAPSGTKKRQIIVADNLLDAKMYYRNDWDRRDVKVIREITE